MSDDKAEEKDEEKKEEDEEPKMEDFGEGGDDSKLNKPKSQQ